MLSKKDFRTRYLRPHHLYGSIGAIIHELGDGRSPLALVPRGCSPDGWFYSKKPNFKVMDALELDQSTA